MVKLQKIYLVLLAVILALLVGVMLAKIVVSKSVNKEIRVHDANGDGTVDVSDVVYMLSITCGDGSCTDDFVNSLLTELHNNPQY